MKRKRNMKRKRMNITDLDVDVLRLIMVLVAKSHDGARSFARAISGCKGFMELAEDKEVLKSVVFDEGRVSVLGESFWNINGLLSKCARARNMAAIDILLAYLVEKLQCSAAKLRALKSIWKDLDERLDAVTAVFTRARLGAVMLAKKKYKKIFQDVRMDLDEIRKHANDLEQFKKFEQQFHDLWMVMDEISMGIEGW